MTRVTFLIGEFPPMQGGIADHTAILAHHLTPLGIQPAVLIDHRFPSDARPDFPVYRAIDRWNYRTWFQIKRFLQTNAVDVLHIQYQAAAFDLTGWVNWLPWVARFWPVRPKIVTTMHDLRIPYLFPKAGPLRTRAVTALAQHSDAVICTNVEDAAILRRQPWGRKVAHIPLGNNVPVNPPPNFDRAAWRQSLGFSTESLVLVYFGFLNESKGGEDLIALLGELVDSGLDARLLLVGGDVGDSDPSNAAYARRIRADIKARNLGPRIVTTGYVELPQVSAHLLAGDVAVLPYRDGVSFRRTTLLAVLAHGLPVVSTEPNVPLPEIVPGGNMLLAPPGNVAALTAAVTRLATDSAQRAQLAREAATLGAKFDWGAIAARTAQVYHRLTTTGGPA